MSVIQVSTSQERWQWWISFVYEPWLLFPCTGSTCYLRPRVEWFMLDPLWHALCCWYRSFSQARTAIIRQFFPPGFTTATSNWFCKTNKWFYCGQTNAGFFPRIHTVGAAEKMVACDNESCLGQWFTSSVLEFHANPEGNGFVPMIVKQVTHCQMHPRKINCYYK